jgi:hypothetical protein
MEGATVREGIEEESSVSSMSNLTATPAVLKPNTKLKPKDRHIARRYSWGHNKKLVSQITKSGGGREWFAEQLHPERIKDRQADKVWEWYPYLQRSPKELWRIGTRPDPARAPYQIMWDLGAATMMRRVVSKRQLHEVMVDFWSNLLHVPLGDDLAWAYRVSYDRMIRKHALTNFEDLLRKSILHPAVGLYLDNAFSYKDAPNENLGRELLELHTLGVDGGYDERDVKNTARLLTGWRVEFDYSGGTIRDFYDPTWHHRGKITVMGFRSRNRDADGRRETKKLLKYLANHEATAQRIAKRLCVKFVSDDPSRDLVRTVKRTWLRSGTDIKATLRAMVDHPEFAKSGGEKVRMPLEDHLAAIRALRIKPKRPQGDTESFPMQAYFLADRQGQTPYGWPAPDGYPEENQPWVSPGRALASLDLYRRYAVWERRDDARYPKHTSWLPDLPARFEDVINHVSRKLLGKRAGRKLKEGVSLRTGIALNKRMTAADLPDYTVNQILMVLLGSPDHLKR